MSKSSSESEDDSDSEIDDDEEDERDAVDVNNSEWIIFVRKQMIAES